MLLINEFIIISKIRFSKTKLDFWLWNSEKVIVKFYGISFYREIYLMKFYLINLS